MESKEWLPAKQCCSFYNIEYDFLKLLNEHGLIEIIHTKEQHYVHVNTLRDLEKVLRMHFDMDINLEGIEAIKNLLYRIESMQQEIKYLKDKLKIYERETVLSQ